MIYLELDAKTEFLFFFFLFFGFGSWGLVCVVFDLSRLGIIWGHGLIKSKLEVL